MARALIVGCGCRGRMLGGRLAGDGWQVRGTTRDAAGVAAIESAGIEAALADPDAVGTVYEQIRDVTVVVWLMGSARGQTQSVALLNGDRMERLLEKLVDSPVRGFVYEAGGTASAQARDRGSAIVREAAERWRIPVEVVADAPDDPDAWCGAMQAALGRLIGATGSP